MKNAESKPQGEMPEVKDTNPLVTSRATESITITFNANGGTSAPDPITTEPGIVTLPEQLPTYSGWKFYAWVPQGGKPLYFPGISYLFLQSITLYALWRRTQVSNGASGKIVSEERYLFSTNNCLIDGDLPDPLDAGLVVFIYNSSYARDIYVAEASSKIGETYNLTRLVIVWSSQYSGYGPLTGDLVGNNLTMWQRYRMEICWTTTASESVGPAIYRLVLGFDSQFVEALGFEFLGWWVQKYNKVDNQWVQEADATLSYEKYYASILSTDGKEREYLAPTIRPKRWACTLDAQGGTVSPSSIQIVKGYPYGRLNNGELPTPVWGQHRFLGWYNSHGVRILPQTEVFDNRSVTLFAWWADVNYTVIFDGNGGTVTPSLITGIIGTSITLPTPIPPAGTSVTFAGWYYVDEYESEVVVGGSGDSYRISGDVTIVAHWSSETCTVNFDSNGGTVTPTSITRSIGTSITLPTPTYPGAASFSFAGWYYIGDNPHEDEPVGMGGSIYSIVGNVTLVAFWQITITFNANGGTSAPDPIITEPGIVTLPEQLATIDETIYPGWKFYAWTAQVGEVTHVYRPGISYLFLQSITLYAAWRRTQVSDGASGKIVSERRYLFFANECTISGTLPDPLDAVLVDFVKNSSYARDIYVAEASSKTGETYNLTRLVIVKSSQYSGFGPLTGDLVGSNLTMRQRYRMEICWTTTASESVGPAIHRLVLGFNSQFVEALGFEFLGWWVQKYNKVDNQWVQEADATLSYEKYYESILSTDGNEREYIAPIIRLKRWTCTLDAQGGTVSPSSIQIVKGYPYGRLNNGELPTPDRSLFTFIGWFTESGTQVTAQTVVASAGDVTLFAHWVNMTFTVTFDAQGGTVTPSSISGAIGEIITLPTPTRSPATSYRFAGWYYVDASQSEVFVGMGGDPYEIHGDITLIAHWHSMTSGNILIRQTPEWATSATWSYEDYGEDSRAASGSDPGAIGMLRWQIVLPSDPKTYFESIHFGIWGDDGYIGTYPSSTTPWGPIEVCGPPPSQEMEGEFEVPYRWGDYIDVQTLAGMTVEYAYIFRQSNALLYWGDKMGTPLAANNEGKLMYGHKAYTQKRLQNQ